LKKNLTITTRTAARVTAASWTITIYTRNTITNTNSFIHTYNL